MNGTEREKELRYYARKMIIVMAKEESRNMEQVVSFKKWWQISVDWRWVQRLLEWDLVDEVSWFERGVLEIGLLEAVLLLLLTRYEV